MKTTSMIRHAVVVLAFGALATSAAIAADDSKADVAALQGNWVAVSGEVSGQKVDDDAIKVFKLAFKGNRVTYVGELEATFTVDTSKTPRVIALTALAGPRKGKTQRAIYSVEKDTLKLSIPDPDAENPPLPTGFTTKAGERIAVVTFRRDAGSSKGK